MADASDQTETLLARATTAIAEAKRLTDEGYALHKCADDRMRRMYFHASFYPKTFKIFYPANVFAAAPPSSRETDDSL